MWENNKTGEMYLGYYIGPHDEGYVSSSSTFNSLYKVEPDNWARRFVAWGTAEEMRAFETGWLKGIDARNHKYYINKWNNDDYYVHTNVATEHSREFLVGTLKEARKKVGTNNKFYYTVNIDGNYAHCKPEWVSDKDDARITNMLGKKVACTVTWKGNFAYFSPAKLNEAE